MILIFRNYGLICLGIIQENGERKFRIERAEKVIECPIVWHTKP